MCIYIYIGELHESDVILSTLGKKCGCINETRLSLSFIYLPVPSSSPHSLTQLSYENDV